jgi:hypothetical protein
MEQLQAIATNWHFLLGVALGVVVGPHIKNLVSKFKK